MSGLIRLQPQVDELLPLYIERVRCAVHISNCGCGRGRNRSC